MRRRRCLPSVAIAGLARGSVCAAAPSHWLHAATPSCDRFCRTFSLFCTQHQTFAIVVVLACLSPLLSLTVTPACDGWLTLEWPPGTERY